MVVEFNVYYRLKIVKFLLNIVVINASISNKYNVKIIIALNLQVALFWLSYKVLIGSYNKNNILKYVNGCCNTFNYKNILLFNLLF